MGANVNIDFQIKTMIIAFISTIILSIITIPILKKLKVGQIEREDGPESHLKKGRNSNNGRNNNINRYINWSNSNVLALL